MDLLPKHMCHRCSYKLEEFHKFYVDCLKTDANLKSQLSWMRKEDPQERVGIPMVQIENVKIKIEPPDYDAYNISPMADNVNYINSVAFQPNDLSYAAAAYRCRCCCDKMDQSNRNLSTNYQRTAMSRCNRNGNIETVTNGQANGTLLVKRNLFNDRTFQEQSNVPTTVTGNKKKTNSSDIKPMEDVKSMTVVNEEVTKSVFVRNLRPRKISVNYMGSKRKPAAAHTSKTPKSDVTTPQLEFEATQIKLEKFDDFDGRILRPRKGTVDYVGPKRKYSRNKNQRSRVNGYRVDEHKVRNIASKLKVPSREVSIGDMISSVKQEHLSDLEDNPSDEPLASLSSNERSSNLANEIGALSNDLLANIQNERVNCVVLGSAESLVALDKLKSPRITSRSKPKSERVNLNGIADTGYSTKYLRSHDVILRNGRIKKLGNTEVSARKLRRSLRNLSEAGKPTERDLMKAIRGIVTAKNISASIKLVDNNIKHYCEECNTKFVSKELFKLHVCYH
ncbi:hypothetical protein WN55_04751 [Dufourea novaeangliae]|uniref:C2H2-type domain-containing protein n=2 Tax=Dufourea novaeangliae TaxID=178035 RepID=A0A154P1S2_DUFNO|nr:hypothetical protein WN55_04751 [Dufourea novaeangliae]